jgi:hypothetical protein
VHVSPYIRIGIANILYSRNSLSLSAQCRADHQGCG